ncbi:actin-related protein 6 isoform X1 [Selaginella moellendorffii]|uniref:actin-related protein 6 isoform X1 n=1 Tax=Selaginella moellendorffii TaxID=88036 RepID=UPI000D1C44AA|nr:actin-related protein 6 isoform X1 [Selaginella moellendorffii]XP_024544641.1 actin-related protein 6 isoform X1 [Selaginella moellendorffii]|eukprot:XP_024544640.1 actin-related protein 6 isoform X1 [Selaginella moellendorffii]
MDDILVLDNGGGFVKAGIVGTHDDPIVVPNCLARPRGSKKWIIADQLEKCDEIQGISLRRPFDRGYLVHCDAEKEVWDRVFKALVKVRPPETALFLVEPPFTLGSIRKNTDELVFEEFGFQSLFVSHAAPLVHLYEANRRPKSRLALGNCSLVVDCGFSFTHAVPIVQGFPVYHGIKRINLGGKALTNYLKELVSYRAWNVMDETYIMEDVKHSLCFCSKNVLGDLDVARKKGRENYIRCQYVLPDGVKNKRGFVKDPAAAAAYFSKQGGEKQGEEKEEAQAPMDVDAAVDEAAEASDPNRRNAIPVGDDQELTLTNERFMVPEMLFQPADLGMEEAGLSECIVRAINSCHPDLHPLLYSKYISLRFEVLFNRVFYSIILTGGCVQFPFFKEKLESELRPLVPDEYNLNIQLTDSPIKAPWYGGALLASSPEFQGCSVTKKQYEEEGSHRCRWRFLQ